MASDQSTDPAAKREQLQDARNAERGNVASQAKSLASEATSQGIQGGLAKGSDALSGQTGKAAKGADKTPDAVKATGKATGESSGGVKSSSKVSGDNSSSTAKEAKGNAITDRSQSAYAVSKDDSAEEKAAASISSGISRLDKSSSGGGLAGKAAAKAEDTAVAKAEQIGKKVGDEGVGGGAGKVAGAAAADATKVGAGAVKGATQGGAPGAIKGAVVGAAKTKTVQKILAVVVVPGCLLVAVIGLVIISSLGSTVVNMIVATSEEAQGHADVDVSEDEDDPDSEDNPCRDEGTPADCAPASTAGDGGGGSSPDIEISEDGWTSPLPAATNSMSGYAGNSESFADPDSENYEQSRETGLSSVAYHTAIDLASGGTDVVAANEGVVHEVGDATDSANPEWRITGLFVVLDHGDDTYTTYNHLAEGSIEVEEGDEVEPGDVLATEGNTSANSEDGMGVHLHFQIIADGIHLDPVRMYEEWDAELMPQGGTPCESPVC